MPWQRRGSEWSQIENENREGHWEKDKGFVFWRNWTEQQNNNCEISSRYFVCQRTLQYKVVINLFLLWCCENRSKEINEKQSKKARRKRERLKNKVPEMLFFAQWVQYYEYSFPSISLCLFLFKTTEIEKKKTNKKKEIKWEFEEEEEEEKENQQKTTFKVRSQTIEEKTSDEEISNEKNASMVGERSSMWWCLVQCCILFYRCGFKVRDFDAYDINHMGKDQETRAFRDFWNRSPNAVFHLWLSLLRYGSLLWYVHTSKGDFVYKTRRESLPAKIMYTEGSSSHSYQGNTCCFMIVPQDMNEKKQQCHKKKDTVGEKR